MPSAPDAPVIFVLAGVNGAGKSSVGGESLRDAGLAYFNPDEVARRIQYATDCAVDEANAEAWQEGRRRLEAAIHDRASYAFESTLGGHTFPRLLAEAARAGIDVHVWFVGLRDPEQHIARVRARVREGGHDIPEAKIRERWETSRRNLADLLPHIAELRVFDNSAERDPVTGTIPPPRLVMHWSRGRIAEPSVDELKNAPAWARPIVDAARRLHESKSA